MIVSPVNPTDINWALVGGLALMAFMASWVGTGLIRRYLLHKSILDHPNERSSHVTPTPRGGGVAVTVVIVLALGSHELLNPALTLPVLPFILLMALLAVLSWLDDLWDLSALVRLLAQVVVAGIGIYILRGNEPFFAGFLPGLLDPMAAALLWVWFINLFNFMDGIDGITGVESISIGAGLVAISLTTGSMADVIMPGLAVMATMAGFLIWNWHPAKIFLGDVGSVPLGFLLGGLVLFLCQQGHPVPALILTCYYLADATLTLTKRGLRGEKIWQAHKEHFYQQATQKGLSHAKVSTMIALTNGLLIVLAVFALTMPVFALAAAIVVTAGLLLIMKKPS